MLPGAPASGTLGTDRAEFPDEKPAFRLGVPAPVPVTGVGWPTIPSSRRRPLEARRHAEADLTARA